MSIQRVEFRKRRLRRTDIQTKRKNVDFDMWNIHLLPDFSLYYSTGIYALRLDSEEHSQVVHGFLAAKHRGRPRALHGLLHVLFETDAQLEAQAQIEGIYSFRFHIQTKLRRVFLK